MSGEPEGSEGFGMEEEPSTGPVEPVQSSGGMEEARGPEGSGEAAPTAPQPEGRRTQLRKVRDSRQILANEVGRIRKSHELNTKKLESQVASLRKELAIHARASDMGAHLKSHAAGSKALEKQVASLRSELASLRGQMAKEAAKSRAREEAALSRIVKAAKASRPAKKLRARRAKKR